MAPSRSDALVLFGVTGDLAHKMIFPALYALVKRGALNVPVIGVALPKWSPARLHTRVTDSIKRSGGIDNQRAFDHLLSLLKYVSGDYKDPGTFGALKKALGKARHPAHYLAIPPSIFGTAIKGLGAENLAEHARVIVEKPFGRDLASAKELNKVARAVFPEERSFASTTSSERRRSWISSISALPIRSLNRSGIETTLPASKLLYPKLSA